MTPGRRTETSVWCPRTPPHSQCWSVRRGHSSEFNSANCFFGSGRGGGGGRESGFGTIVAAFGSAALAFTSGCLREAGSERFPYPRPTCITNQNTAARLSFINGTHSVETAVLRGGKSYEGSRACLLCGARGACRLPRADCHEGRALLHHRVAA